MDFFIILSWNIKIRIKPIGAYSADVYTDIYTFGIQTINGAVNLNGVVFDNSLIYTDSNFNRNKSWFCHRKSYLNNVFECSSLVFGGRCAPSK